MSGESQTHVKQNTGPRLAGPLNHARAAALAAALVPLASVAVSPVQAQQACSRGAIVGDIVWHDVNANGIQDGEEPGIMGAVVTIVAISHQEEERIEATDEYGYYQFLVCGGTYNVIVQRPNGMQTSPPGMGTDPRVDSNGVDDSLGNSVAEVTVPLGGFNSTIDFGFTETPVAQPGTGSHGYWKTHPEAWPVETITVGGVGYTKAETIAILWSSGSDRTPTMFSSLVPAMLNVLIGNDGSCVSSTIEAANDWMKSYGPVGKKVHPASPAWKIGERLHRQLDNYNNGMLCAPARE
jgi:hypothetical protein